jgi:hypothetical protein
MWHSVTASMKRRPASLALVGLVVSTVGLSASGGPASGSPAAMPRGPWTGEWKVVRIESDSGRRLPGGRLTFVQSGKVVCASWSWNPFADGRLGLSSGTASGVTMRATGRDARARVRWTIALRAEVVDRFEGPFSEVEAATGETVEGTMYGTRIGPPRRQLVC